MRFFFTAHATALTLHRVKQPRFLVDLTASFQDFHLASRLNLNRLANEAQRIDVLGFRPGAKFVRADGAHRYVYIRPHAALFHITVAGAQIAHDIAKFFNIGARFVTTTKIGLAHNLHQRNTRTVQIDERALRILIMD